MNVGELFGKKEKEKKVTRVAGLDMSPQIRKIFTEEQFNGYQEQSPLRKGRDAQK